MDSFSHRRKLARAEFHIQNAEAMVAVWVHDGYRVFEQADGEGGRELCAEQLKPLPDELGLVIGDALQGLRNCLDNLAYALARKNTPGMTPDDEKAVAFPIDDGAVKVGSKRIQHMSRLAQNDVCALAPDPARDQLESDPLWLLNKTANRDKHREVHTVAGATGIRGFTIGNGYIDRMEVLGIQRLEVSGGPRPVLRYGPRTRINAQMSHAFQILFDAEIEVANREIFPTLRLFHEHIRDTVFPRLEAHL